MQTTHCLLVFCLILSSLVTSSQATGSAASTTRAKSKTAMAPPESAENGAKAPTDSTFQRLPKDVVPKSYQIRLEPDLVNFTFAGSVVVDVSIEKETSKIVLNAADLDIQSASFTSSGGTTPTLAKSVDLKKEDELLIITFSHPLKVVCTIIFVFAHMIS